MSVKRKLKFDETSSSGSTPRTPKVRYERYNEDKEKISISDASDRDTIKKKILFSGKNRSHFNKDVSCTEIYQQITDKIQENMKRNSSTRTSFMSSGLSTLRSLEEFLEENSVKDEEKYTELLELIRTKNILQNKLDKKLTLVQEHIKEFLESTKNNEEECISYQNIAVEKFTKNMDKYKKSLPDMVTREKEAKMEAFKYTLAFFTD